MMTRECPMGEYQDSLKLRKEGQSTQALGIAYNNLKNLN